MMVPWNRAQSTEMHPDAPPSARPFANNQDDDDTDEWEYEYSTTETESYYVTLDLTTSTAPAQRRARQKRKGVDTKNPENNGPKWKSAGMGLSKRHLEPAPKIGISLEDSGEVEAENDNDDEQNEGDLDANDEKDALITADSGEIKNPSQVQIIGLDTEDPIVSYGGNVFSCRWEQNIGTELLFTEYDPKNPSPVLRSLPGGVDLLGISSARIVSEAARLDPIDHEKTDDVYRETRGRGRRGRGSRGKIRGRGTRRAARFYIPIGKYANRKRKEQGQFLEAMTGIKAAKGEDDAVTVIAIARKANKVWRHHVEGERAVERKKLERAVVKTGRRAEEARARLAEMDRQDEVATVIRGSMAIRRPSKRAGRQKKVGRRRKKSPEPADSPFTRQRQLSYNLDGRPFEGYGDYISTSTPQRWSDLEDDMEMTGMASMESHGVFYESNILDQSNYGQNNYGDSSMAYGDYGDDGLYDEDAPGEDDDTQMPYEWQY